MFQMCNYVTEIYFWEKWRRLFCVHIPWIWFFYFWWQKLHWWWSSIIKETLSLPLVVCVRKFTFCQFYWKRTFILLLPKWRKLAKGGGVGTLFYYSVDCFCLRLQSCLLFQQQQRLRNTVPSFVSQKIEQCYSRESKVTQNLFFLLQLN